MISVDPQTLAAIQNPKLLPRDFLEVRAKRRDNGNAVTDFLWSGTESVSQNVIDPLTGATRNETWFGAGHLVGIGVVPRVSNLTVVRTEVRLSEISSRVSDLVRTYDPKYGTVIMYRSFLDPDTKRFVAPGIPRFLGMVASIEINDPEEGGEGYVKIVCKNFTEDLTRSNPATRSDAYQRLRDPNDNFRKYSATIGQRDFYWGKR